MRKDSDSIKILLDLRILSYEWSGIASYSLSLLQSSRQTTFSDHWVYLFHDEQTLDSLSHQIDVEDVRKQSIFLELPIYNVKNFWVLYKLIRDNDIKVYMTPQFYCPYCFFSCEKISTVHDMIPLTHPGLMKNSKKAKWKLFFYFSSFISMFSCQKIIVNSKSTQKVLERHFPWFLTKKIHVLYPSIIKNKTFSTHLQLPYELHKCSYILYVGRQNPYKNLLTLIKAFQKILKIFTETKLVIAGKIDERYPEIQETIHMNSLKKSVILTDFVDSHTLNQLYNNCLFAVQPSRIEGFGLTSLEPYLFDKFSVVSDIDAHREILGDAALFFDPKNLSQMADQLTYGLSMDSSQKKKLIDEGKKRLESFSMNNMINSLERIFKKDQS